MSSLILTHILTGLTGIAAGLFVVAGVLRQKPAPRANLLFLSATLASCLTGFLFLPSMGVTSAQLVAFFLVALLAIASHARYRKHLDGPWNQVYALATVGALFLNVLITTAQSFLHIHALRTLAPTQHSPAFVAVKVTLLLTFVLLALAAAKRAGRP